MPNADAFDFKLTGNRERPFLGYNSQTDPTNLSPQFLVKGSKNMYVNNDGNVMVRPGLKLIGTPDSTLDGIVASYEFETAMGVTLPIRVLKSGKMQFEYEEQWHDLMTFDKTRFIFAPWWDDSQKSNLLIMVNGDHDLYSWSGAVALDGGTLSQGNTVLITGVSQTLNLELEVLTGGSGAIDVISNSPPSTSSSVRAAIVLNANPILGDDISYIINSGSSFKSGTLQINFVNALPGSPSTTTASVLIGATKEDTMSNLIGFLNNPGGSTTTYVGITDSDTLTAIGYETYTAVNSFKVNGDSSWGDLGFVTGDTINPQPTIIIDGVAYTYDLVAGDYLVNISGTPPPNTFTFQGVHATTNTPTDTFDNDFIVVLNNQLIVGSYTSKIIYISADEDFTDFSNSGDLISGDPDFAILDEFPTGFVVKDQSIYTFAGNSSTYVLTPNTPVPVEQPISGGNALVITTVEKQVGAGKSAAISQEFITTVGTDILYLAQDHQLRQLGTIRNIVTQKTPSLSKAIKQELQDEDFTGGALRFVDEFAYITAPIPGRTYLYQIRDDVDNVGNLTAARLWHPYQEWGISRIAVIDGVVGGYSSTYPQLYQLWYTDQWHDDSPQEVPSPYECVARFAYQNNGLETGMITFNMCYYEGYIAPNSDLTGRVRFDYLGGTHNQGQQGVQEVVISSLTEPGWNGIPDDGSKGMTLFRGESDAELGVSQVGVEENGGTTDLLKGFPKFRVIQDIEPTDVFEYQVELYSYSAGSRWSIKCFGVNASESDNNPLFLRKS